MKSLTPIALAALLWGCSEEKPAAYPQTSSSPDHRSAAAAATTPPPNSQIATGDSTRVAPVTPNHGAPIEPTTTPSSSPSLPPTPPPSPPSSMGGGPTQPDDTAVNQRDSR